MLTYTAAPEPAAGGGCGSGVELHSGSVDGSALGTEGLKMEVAQLLEHVSGNLEIGSDLDWSDEKQPGTILLHSGT